MTSVASQPNVTEYVRALLAGRAEATVAPDAYYRLLRAGLVRQDRDGKVILRCELYRRYLQEHVLASPA